MFSVGIITAALFLLPFCILQPVSAQTNSTNSSSSTGQRLITVGDINGVNYQTYLYYPSETYPLVNYNDVLVFAWWTNYTNLYLVREQGAGSIQSGYLTTTLAATGTYAYSFTSEPTALATSYPYNATFGIGNRIIDASGTATYVGNIVVAVTSTSHVPVTRVNAATTTVYPTSAGATASVTASATHTAMAAGRVGVNAAVAVLGLLAPAAAVVL